MHPWPHRDGAGLGIIEGVLHQDALTIVTRATGTIVLAFLLPLPLAFLLPPLLGMVAGEGGTIGGHDDSCSSWHGGRYCRGCPPLEGAE
jgi:hypothetical protein